MRCDLPYDHPDAAGWVYVFRSLDFIKVGMSRNVAQRLNTIMDNNPHPIEVLLRRKMPWLVTKEIEQAIHAELAPLRHHKEWYRATADQVIPIVLRHVKGAQKAHRARLEGEKRRAAKEPKLEEISYTAMLARALKTLESIP